MVNNTLGTFRIHIDNIPIGKYRLSLNLPTTTLVYTDIVFNSSSTKISPSYSYAVRESIGD